MQMLLLRYHEIRVYCAVSAVYEHVRAISVFRVRNVFACAACRVRVLRGRALRAR